jgi:hypothetical protein
MLLHAKSPLSFLGGAVFSLFLLYLWRISSFGFDIDPYLEGKASQKVTDSNENSSAISNETITEPVVEKYSIQDVLSNSTLGVSPVVVAEVKPISPPNSLRKSWRSTFHLEVIEVTY